MNLQSAINQNQARRVNGAQEGLIASPPPITQISPPGLTAKEDGSYGLTPGL